MKPAQKITIEQLRALVNEVFDNLGSPFDIQDPSDEVPGVNVNAVVDPSAAITDPINPNFTPQSRPELDVAVRELTKSVPADRIASTYQSFKDVVDQDNEKEEQEMSVKDDAKKKAPAEDKSSVEESVRRAVRKMLAEIELPPVRKIPYGVHGDEYMRKVKKGRDDLARVMKNMRDDEWDRDEPEFPEEEVGKKKRAYKSTAIGGMADVGGSTFDDLAKELGLSVAGAKRAVDFALEKARFLMTMDADEREILVLNAMNDYINMLAKSGELTSADIALMKDHPEIIRELDGFREFLHNAVRRQRKQDQKIEDPLGEASAAQYESDEDVCPKCNGNGHAPSPKPGSTAKCKACNGTGAKQKKS